MVKWQNNFNGNIICISYCAYYFFSVKGAFGNDNFGPTIMNREDKQILKFCGTIHH